MAEAHVDDSQSTPEHKAWLEERARRDADLEALVADVTRWRAKAVSTWSALQATRDDLDALQARMDEATAGFEHERATLRQLAGMEVTRLEDELRDVRSSTSWRVTSPLRKASSLLKRRP